MQKHSYSLVTLFSLLSACAHVNIAKEKSYATPKAGYGVVYFYRESHFVGGATSYNIWNNNTKPPIKLGSLQNGSYFYTYVKPGHYQFVINGEVQGSAEFDIEAGKTYYVQNRIDVGFWAARPKLTEVTKSEGEKQIKDSDMKMTTLDDQSKSAG
jgi:hypothetical protein